MTLVGTLMYAVFLIAFGVNKSFPLGLIIVGVLGMTDTLSMTMRSTIVQLTTPDQLLGRRLPSELRRHGCQQFRTS